MQNKIWDVDVLGVLAEEEYVRDRTGRSNCFINTQNVIQFLVRLVSKPPETFPNETLFTGFATSLEPYGFEDRPWEDDETRKRLLLNFMEAKMLIFQPQRKVRPDGDYFNMFDVRTCAKTEAYTPQTAYVPIPIFSEGKHAASEAEFLDRLQNNRYIGRVEHISTEPNDTPQYVLWRGADGQLAVYGPFDKHLYAQGGFSLRYTRLMKAEFREAWFDDAVFEPNRQDILFVSLDIYNQLAEVVNPQTEADGGAEVAAAAAGLAVGGSGHAVAARPSPEAFGLGDAAAGPSAEPRADADVGSSGMGSGPAGERLAPAPEGGRAARDDGDGRAVSEGPSDGAMSGPTFAGGLWNTPEDAEGPAADERRRDADEHPEAVFLEQFAQQARDRNLLYREEDLVNFHTAMKSSTLVILAGMSGTGKSRLVEVYGRTLGMDNEQLNIIPVRPSWTDDADLIGYVDSIHNVYRPGDSGLVDTLIQAENHPEKLYIICFDEMNLARVEHYFSQFLSVLEQPEGRRELRLYNEELMTRLYNYKEYSPSITIGNNVMFVGTVNLDESTYHFSDKVLDRANVISLQMRPFALLKDLGERRFEKGIRRQWTAREYADFRNSSDALQLTDDELALLDELHQTFQAVDPNRGIGYRVVRQMDAYLKNLPQGTALDRRTAFDLQLVQRVLTKVRGSEDELQLLVGRYHPERQTVVDSQILDCLNRHHTVSDFAQTRSVISHKAKELRLHGYTF
ncbi:MAG: AAA family ATPase [Alicyclobacillus sp.]|nr:AAA family ATPase [Alicyclobacillus sp.]